MKILIKNSIWSVLETVTSAILSFGMSIFIGGFYGVENLGAYSFIASTSAIAVAISNFGVTPYYIRRIAQSQFTQYYTKELINIRVLISTPFYVFVVSVIIFATSDNWLRYDYAGLVVLFGAVNVNMLLAAVFNSQQRNRELFVCSLIYKLGACLLMILVATHESIEFAEFIIFLCAIAVVQVYYVLRYKIGNLNIKIRARRLLAKLLVIKKTLTIGISGIFEAIMNRIDILVIGYFLSEGSVGIYSAAYSYFMIYNLFSLALTKVFFARFSFYYKTDIDRAKRFLKIFATLTLLYAICASVLLYSSAEFFINFFYGEKFNSAIELVRGLSFCVAPLTMGRLLMHVMNAAGAFNYAIYAAGVGIMVSISVNFALIDEYQIWAPIYATFAVETIVLLVLVLLLAKIKKFRSNS